MTPYSGKKNHGPVCAYGCCYKPGKCQPHYRAPNATEKTISRRRARAIAKRAIKGEVYA